MGDTTISCSVSVNVLRGRSPWPTLQKWKLGTGEAKLCNILSPRRLQWGDPLRDLVKISIAMKKHYDQKQFGKERVSFSLQVPHHTSSPKEVRAGAQTGWEMEAETDAEATETLHFFAKACSACFLTAPIPPAQEL